MPSQSIETPSEQSSLGLSETKSMRCPLCNALVDTTPKAEKPKCRPFCSERCKTIDLAHWLTGAYAVPGEPVEASGGQEGEA